MINTKTTKGNKEMNVPNLRQMEVSAASAKDFRDTKLNDVVAHEPADTVNGTNDTKEHIAKGGKPSGPFGNQGRP